MHQTTHHGPHIPMEDEHTIKSTDIDTAFNVQPPPGSSGIRLSREFVQFLMDRKESPHEVLVRPVVQPPEVDDSMPLSHYYISTSHNTYLLSYQLLGKTDATAYTRVLSHSCRCVEIDVWPSSNGPIVTHGWTWTDHIPFRDVCRAIGKAVQPNDWPVMVSLECHVDIHEQGRIAHTMKSVWGEKLVDKELPGLQGEALTPGQLRGKILLMIEYYPSTAPADTHGKGSHWNGGSDPSEEDSQREKFISPALAALGVYGRSIKPSSGWLTHETISEPRHAVYNLSEVALQELLPGSHELLVRHSQRHLRRVYPKATRITSANLVPLDHWSSGAHGWMAWQEKQPDITHLQGTHISALNWQRYDRGLQFNEAMFVGSGGWVCKPDRLRGIKALDDRRPVRLTCELVGGCNILKTSHDIKAYVYAELFLPFTEQKWQSQTRHLSSTIGNDVCGDVLWNEKFHWEFLEDEIAFLRLSMYREEWGKDDRLGTFCARVSYLQQGWRFVRLLDKRGKHNGGLLLLRFTYV